jgi:polyisoprenoid-binding protein YceI
MSTAQAESTIPTGVWKSDPVHSSAGFVVRHMVGAFHGGFGDFAGQLADEDGKPKLSGTTRIESVDINQEDLKGHLLSPEFFDVEQYPEIRFESNEIRRDGDQLVVDGELSLKGTTKAVEARGRITDPITDPTGAGRIGIDLETTVDRHDFGLDWQMELPDGGDVLGDEVTITAHLELVKEQ